MPQPRELALGGESVRFGEVLVEAAPDCDAARAIVDAWAAAFGQPTAASGAPALRVRIDTQPTAQLPPEGYALVVDRPAGEPQAVITAADPGGAYYGARTLIELAAGTDSGTCELRTGSVRDWPELGWRGTIEGFYGTPWSHADRLEHLRFAGRHKLNAYVYAPKDDPYHRAQWRDPYPDAELTRLAELVEEARRHHVRFVFTVSPGLSMVYSDPGELDRLLAKLQQVWDVGVRDVGLLFDDIEPDLVHEEDVAAYGTEPGSSALAHADVCRRVIEEFLRPRDADRPLLMVPTDYAGTGSSPYREKLAGELDGDVLVWWTGRDIVVGDVTREHIDAAAQNFRHRLLLWDNFPVNDFDFSRVFLGPLTGRTLDLSDAPLAGVTANPMPQAAASEVALATVADWAWNPDAYDAAASHRRVRASLGADDAVDMLIESCSSWPPSAPQHPELSALLDDVLAGDAAAAKRANVTFHTMARSAEPSTARGERLARELKPWLDTQAAMGRAGLAALDHLASPTATTRSAAEKLLAEAQTYEQNVLKSVVPPFVERVLAQH
ncbi:beta-N-acetylhexosaminidase [Phytoactinopolyspora halotolerans]|uniref:Beta-N-acetylhexosaminidase n=1 Tax=Phytoactinopolyspora halotolerans TaxID=1981512 RepID=A0A6L9S2P4_9ACTN|nr:beta-N-acetylhexosaminidase [Phytoactinopolyspora halotolerans]